jgi:hypothetical protein
MNALFKVAVVDIFERQCAVSQGSEHFRRVGGTPTARSKLRCPSQNCCNRLLSIRTVLWHGAILVAATRCSSLRGGLSSGMSSAAGHT